MITYFRGN